MSDSIRILLVGHEGLFLRGLLACLAGDDEFEVAGTVSTAAEAYRAADALLPDVALISSTLPDAPGLSSVAEFHRRHASIAVIVTSQSPNDEEFFEAIRSSAAAYGGQDVEEALLIEWIKRAARREYVINEQLLENPVAAARMLAEFRATVDGDLSPQLAFAPLTTRELEILQKISEGMTNSEIGFALGISAQTVKNHVTSILRKLAVNDRTQAVVQAIKKGWLTFE